MNRGDLISLHGTMCDEALEIMKNKNRDRAHHSKPFVNFNANTIIGVDPRKAVLSKMIDKLVRMCARIDNPALHAADRAIDDPIDIINYCVLFEGMSQELENDRRKHGD